MALTLGQFTSFVEEISTIIKMESGDNTPAKPQSVTGEAAHKLAMQMFGKKKK